jgi:hypothetical protein
VRFKNEDFCRIFNKVLAHPNAGSILSASPESGNGETIFEKRTTDIDGRLALINSLLYVNGTESQERKDDDIGLFDFFYYEDYMAFASSKEKIVPINKAKIYPSRRRDVRDPDVSILSESNGASLVHIMKKALKEIESNGLKEQISFIDDAKNYLQQVYSFGKGLKDLIPEDFISKHDNKHKDVERGTYYQLVLQKAYQLVGYHSFIIKESKKFRTKMDSTVISQPPEGDTLDPELGREIKSYLKKEKEKLENLKKRIQRNLQL